VHSHSRLRRSSIIMPLEIHEFPECLHVAPALQVRLGLDAYAADLNGTCAIRCAKGSGYSSIANRLY
jgi:hypothetical protein